jgi:quinol---cytochrome c reductase iron-sulfur subunit, bacillus type
VSGSDPNQVSRRDFIKVTAAIVGGFIGALIGIPSIAYLLSPATKSVKNDAVIALGPLENYPIGVPARFDFTLTKVNGWERTAINYGLYIVRKNDREVRVFSDICTHLACRVSWHPDFQHYISPCHNGHFDIMGKNISGPPPRPLDEFKTRIEDGNLFAQLPAFKRYS